MSSAEGPAPGGAGPGSDLRGVAALRLPYVRPFVLGRGLAVLGSEVLGATAALQIWKREQDPLLLGLVGLVQFVPVLLLIVYAGALADRRPRRTLALLAQAGFGAAALLAAALTLGDAPTATLFLPLLLGGVARAFARPAVGALLPQLLPPWQLAPVNTWVSTTFQLAMVLGPVAAGVLMHQTGGALAGYLVAAAAQLAFGLLLLRLPRVPPPPQAAGRTWRDVFAGFHFVGRQPLFLAAITLDLFAVLLGGATALLPVYADQILHCGDVGFGWLRAATALGAFAMALALTHLPEARRPGRLLLLVVAGFGLSIIGFGLSRWYALSFVCLLLSGAFDAVSVVIRMTLEQALTPDALRGRVSALNYIFIGASNELGAFESGLAASLVGPVAAVAGGGAGTLLVVLLVARRWPALARLGPLSSLRPLPVSDGPGADAGRAAPA